MREIEYDERQMRGLMMDIDKIKNNKRTPMVISLIQLYRRAEFDEATIMTQLVDGYSRSFSRDELKFLVDSIK